MFFLRTNLAQGQEGDFKVEQRHFTRSEVDALQLSSRKAMISFSHDELLFYQKIIENTCIGVKPFTEV